ncbi:MAG: PilZ domain-containing protein [Ectothiorhodospiraceae bacterium]|nr:PilZ domain-containing protein [Chromatiales bacterium]MCP5155435.1 PilZ domain-containing protein [Ectothiorhodospiraceae bacterium]
MKAYHREHPRVAMSLHTEIVGASGVIHAQTVNISRAGLQLECDRVTRDAVFPGGQPLSPSARPQVRLRIQLPRRAESCWVEVDARGVIFRRIGADDFRLGLEFEHFEEGGYHCLERFVDENWGASDDEGAPVR